MRVYELAKELGVSSKDLLNLLKDGGHVAATHMAVLSDEAYTFIKKHFSDKNAVESNKKPAINEPRKASQEMRAEIKKTTPKDSGFLSVSKPELQQIENDLEEVIEKSVEPIAPAFSETLEEIEQREQRDQERIKRLLQSTGYAGFTPGQQQGPRRRRRRRVRQVVQEVKKAAVTEAAIDKPMALCEVADIFGKSSGDLIMALLKKGMPCNRNNILNLDIIRDLARQFGITVNIKSSEQEVDKRTLRPTQGAVNGTTRWPVVVVMGHVDHGKTTLLDHIRKMNVAASEKGGITQHIRAWEVDSAHGKIVFLDTPGHEAFSYLRERGSSVTDIAILVVAADDGVKPQTIEAIKHAKDAGVPIIVAINKIDKASPSAIETVKRQLSQQHELLPEEWGGQTIFVPISAKTGQGVTELLEMIVLQSQLMDLKADKNVPARAFVLESHVEKGFGPVATVICQEGTLKQGDFFICGSATGKIRILLNSSNQKITQAGPSTPAQVVGFDSLIGIGDVLNAVSQAEYSKARSQRAVEQTISTQAAPVIQAQSFDASKTSSKKFINLIIKTDTRGSKEAVMDSIEKLIKQHKDIKCPINIVTAGIGDVSESDIELADSTQALILGLHTKIEKNAQLLAKDIDVNVQNYQIIYELIDYIEKLLLSKKEIAITWTKVGEAVVRKVFDIKGIGIIAGCYMREGVLSRNNKVVCIRNGRQLGEAKVSTLQRDRKSVKEIHAGYECGFTADGFNEWQEGDTVLCYAETKAA